MKNAVSMKHIKVKRNIAMYTSTFDIMLSLIRG